MTVPLEQLEADPELRELLELAPVSLWMGDGIHAHGFPMVRLRLPTHHPFVLTYPLDCLRQVRPALLRPTTS